MRRSRKSSARSLQAVDVARAGARAPSLQLKMKTMGMLTLTPVLRTLKILMLTLVAKQLMHTPKNVMLILWKNGTKLTHVLNCAFSTANLIGHFERNDLVSRIIPIIAIEHPPKGEPIISDLKFGGIPYYEFEDDDIWYRSYIYIYLCTREAIKKKTIEQTIYCKYMTNLLIMNRVMGSPYLKWICLIPIDHFTIGNSDAPRKRSSRMLVLQFRMGPVWRRVTL